ncbi:DUF4158 domain-containing protein [Streptomyces althioticus]|uniref:DUF4158 domain-containing protein n=1 Tax=Streptomyces althioticus TaxID=83380 RepID=UPI0033EEBDD7
MAQQVRVPAEQWAAYDWQGRAITRHRTEIRTASGFRAGTEEDQERLAEWLAAELCTRAERKVDKELNAELKKIRGKDAMLLRVAEAALSEPSGMVRRVIYPVVGGERTLKALAAEAAANEARSS